MDSKTDDFGEIKDLFESILQKSSYYLGEGDDG